MTVLQCQPYNGHGFWFLKQWEHSPQESDGQMRYMIWQTSDKTNHHRHNIKILTNVYLWGKWCSERKQSMAQRYKQSTVFALLCTYYWWWPVRRPALCKDSTRKSGRRGLGRALLETSPNLNKLKKKKSTDHVCPLQLSSTGLSVSISCIPV